MPHIPLIHDMAFTQSYIIVRDFPVTFQPEHSHTTFPWLWDERRDSRIGLLPRSGDASRIQWFEAPRCFAFHFANAYDDGDLTIIDLPKHRRMFLTDQNGFNEGAPILVRWTLHRPSGRLTETVLDDRGNEFPRIKWATRRASLSLHLHGALGRDGLPPGRIGARLDKTSAG